jgi:hypothetical protein
MSVLTWQYKAGQLQYMTNNKLKTTVGFGKVNTSANTIAKRVPIATKMSS